MSELLQGSPLGRFLFARLDARAVAWFRMALAIAIPWFFWSRGFQPAAVVPEIFHPLYEHIFVSKVHYLLLVCLCGCLLLGWRSRLCLLIIVFMIFPLGFTNSGSVSRPVLIFATLAFALTRCDAVRFPWQGSRESCDAGPAWPVRLIQLDLSVLYGINAIAKSSWLYLSGDALVDMSLTRSNFLVDMSTGYLTLAFVTVPVMMAAIGSTLAEYTLALGFCFRRLRIGVAVFGVSFHLVLYFIVDIFMLHFASVFLYLAFLLPMTDSKKTYEK